MPGEAHPLDPKCEEDGIVAKTGTLKLKIVNVTGKPIKERVTIDLRHRELSDRQVFKDVDASKTIVIENLHDTPRGTYILTVKSTAYHTLRRFVRIAGATRLTCHVAIHKSKATPKFPTYEQLKTDHPHVTNVLERSDQLKTGQGRTGRALWDHLGKLQRAAFLNIAAKSLVAPIEKKEGILPHVSLLEVHQDRCIVEVPSSLPNRVRAESKRPKRPFRKVDGSLHSAPEGFKDQDSFKTQDRFGNLQLTFFKEINGKRFVADVDIDDAAGIRHFFDVIGHALKDEKTHPYNIYTILVMHQGIDPGYSLVPTSP